MRNEYKRYRSLKNHRHISESYSSHYDGDADYIYNDNVYDFKNNTGGAFVLLLIIMT